MHNENSLVNPVSHTTGAIIISVGAFFILMYIVAPLFEIVFHLFGKYFVPARLGGGSEIDNPSIITLIIRAILISGLSALLALASGFKLFRDANNKIVAAAFASSVLAWGGYIVYLGMLDGVVIEPIVVVLITCMAPLVISYWKWQGKSL